MSLIFIKSAMEPNKDGSYPLALRERDDQHPKGEIYVSGTKVVEAFETPGVLEAIKLGRIVETKDAEGTKPKQTSEKKTPPTKSVVTDKEPAATDDLPDDLPHHEILIAGGVTTLSQLTKLTSDEVDKIPDIGEGRKKDIADYLQANASK